MCAASSHSRAIFNDCQAKAIGELEAKVFEDFLGSPHYNYIIELESKKGVLPSLDDFKVLRVLGEGGFGQVIEVVKRDCGVRYAMKVMKKEAMKQALGVTWRKKIAMEAHLRMAALPTRPMTIAKLSNSTLFSTHSAPRPTPRP